MMKNAVIDPTMSTKPVNDIAPSRPASLAVLMNIGPFSKVPATMIVAPVSESGGCQA
jgi:hypothetical protein